MTNHWLSIITKNSTRIFDFFWRIYIRRIDTYEFSTSIRKAD
nr:MAG TPA: hypothetical protein [Caudoviricetes sp.]